jgi:hypothetical protein
MLSNLSYLQTLVHPSSAIEKHIAARLMKTAAAIETVTTGHGAYRSKSNRPQSAHPGSEFKAVNYTREAN